MAVPKRRMSRANTRSRRAQWKAEATGLVNVSVGGRQHKVPPAVAQGCAPRTDRSRQALTPFAGRELPVRAACLSAQSQALG